MVEESDAIDVVAVSDAEQFRAAVEVRYLHAILCLNATIATLRPDGVCRISTDALSVAGIYDAYQFHLAIAAIVEVLEVYLTIDGLDGILAELREVDVLAAAFILSIIVQRLGQGDRTYDSKVGGVLSQARLIEVLSDAHKVILLVMSQVLLCLTIEVLFKLCTGVVARKLVVGEICQNDQTLR